MLLTFLRTYAILLVAVVVSAAGLAMLLRGLRIAGRRRRAECIQCGYVLGEAALAAAIAGARPTATADEATTTAENARPLSTVCTECGRDPSLDVDALRMASALITLGLASQFIWVLLGASSWSTAAVLLVETSIALVVFAAEPLVERVRRRVGGRPRLKPVPERRWLRIGAVLVVLIGWGWIFARVRHGEAVHALVAMRPTGTPICRPFVSNRTQWMDRVLPPELVYHARVAGIVTEVQPDVTLPLPPAAAEQVIAAWVHGSLTRVAPLVPLGQVYELRILHLDDATYFAEDAGSLPTLPNLAILNLDGSTLTPKAIESLVSVTPNLRTLRVNYLSAEDAAALRASLPSIEIDAAEYFGRRSGRGRR